MSLICPRHHTAALKHIEYFFYPECLVGHSFLSKEEEFKNLLFHFMIIIEKATERYDRSPAELDGIEKVITGRIMKIVPRGPW